MAKFTHTLTSVRGRTWKCTVCGGESGMSNRGQADWALGKSCVAAPQPAPAPVAVVAEAPAREPGITPRQRALIEKLYRSGEVGPGSQSSIVIQWNDIPALSRRLASAIISDALE